MPRAREAREILPDQLRERGATVDVIAAYETRMDGAASDRLKQQLQNGEINVLTFTASSTVRNFAQALEAGKSEKEKGESVGAQFIAPDAQLPNTQHPTPSTLAALVGNVTIAAIGPVTAQTLREFGLNVDIEAEEHTIPGLVAAIEKHFDTTGK